MNRGDLIRIATVDDTGLANDLTTEIRENIVAALNKLDNDVKEQIKFRVTSNNNLEYYDGFDWIEIEADIKAIRDDSIEPLRMQVSSSAPAAIDGRMYYNDTQNVFYVSKNGQWFRLFESGDEKIDRDPPSNAPTLSSKTDTTVTLVNDEDMEFRYQGGAWREGSYFAGLSRNEQYMFESRYKTDDVYKASEPSPALRVKTSKGTQSTPPTPNISGLDHDRVTVFGVSGTEVRLNSGTWYDTPHTFTGLNEKTSYSAYARRKETHTHYVSPQSAAKTFVTPPSADDPTGSPGNGNLIAGNMDAGYFGAVSTSELFSGTEIASACGITQGTAQFSNVGWLKFAIDGKIIFKSQKTYRHSISWDHINSKGCVDGTKTVSKNGHTYKVRLMKGLHENNPTDYRNESNHGSEWNRLMLPIHVNAPSSWAYAGNVNSPTQDWGINFTDADLHTHQSHGSGTFQWCQEVSPTNSSYRVYRGGAGVSYSGHDASSPTAAGSGWSPVLEFIS